MNGEQIIEKKDDKGDKEDKKKENETLKNDSSGDNDEISNEKYFETNIRNLISILSTLVEFNYLQIVDAIKTNFLMDLDALASDSDQLVRAEQFNEKYK